jgi:hypothetical protein
MTKEIQEKELSMLLYFKEFCDKHNLRFYLCGGGLIGAIRHNGFIPWDDDLDLFMPRPDYEKLAELWPKYADTERYTYCRTDRIISIMMQVLLLEIIIRHLLIAIVCMKIFVMV